MLTTEDTLNNLLVALNPRGEREVELAQNLQLVGEQRSGAG